jgi:CBS domain containing-hemolysin-like protein
LSDFAGAALLIPSCLLRTEEVASTQGGSLLLWIAAGGSLVVAAIGALAGASLLFYSPTKLARHLKSDRRSPLITHLHETERDYQALAALLLVAGLVSGSVLAWLGAGEWPVAKIAALVLAVAFLCGYLPTRIAEDRAEIALLATLRFLKPLRLALHYPLLLPLVIGATWFLRLVGIRETPRRDAEEIVEEILAAVGDTAQAGDLREEEQDWIENIVELKDQQASEIMTPRTDMVAFSADLPLLDAIDRATARGFSRYPVYEGKVDHVTGVFYVKDVLALMRSGADYAKHTVGEHMRRPLFVREDIGLVELLREFRQSKVQMAIVLDEYGGTSGLVSIEDILEEIFGDISDEYDVAQEEAIKVIEAGRVIEATGRARVDEVNAILDIDIPEGEDYDTLAGFVSSTLDRIPKTNETVRHDGVEIRILRADDRRISRMRLTLLAPEPNRL